MSKIFSWKPTDSVDVSLIDRQNKELLEIAEELYEALACAKGLGVADHVFAYLTEYASNHFVAEEKLMEQHHYPQLRPHRAEHQQFTNKLLAFKEDFQKGKQGVVTELLPYLQAWIKNHVHGADRHFGDFMKTAHTKSQAARR